MSAWWYNSPAQNALMHSSLSFLLNIFELKSNTLCMKHAGKRAQHFVGTLPTNQFVTFVSGVPPKAKQHHTHLQTLYILFCTTVTLYHIAVHTKITAALILPVSVTVRHWNVLECRQKHHNMCLELIL